MRGFFILNTEQTNKEYRISKEGDQSLLACAFLKI